MRRVQRSMFCGIMVVGGLTLCSVLCGLDYEVQVLPPIPGGKGPDPEGSQTAVVLIATCAGDRALWEGRDDYVYANGLPCQWPDMPCFLTDSFIALLEADIENMPEMEWSISNYFYRESLGKHRLIGVVNGGTGDFLCSDDAVEGAGALTCSQFETEMRREAGIGAEVSDKYYIYVFPRTPLSWPNKKMSGKTWYGEMRSVNGSSGYYTSTDNMFDLKKLVALVAHEYGHCLGRSGYGLPDKYQTPLPRPDVATRAHVGHFLNDGTPWTHVTNKYNSIEEKQGQVRPVFVDIDNDNDLDMFLGVAVKVGADLKGRVLFYEWDQGIPGWKTSVWLRDHNSDIIESHGAPASPEFVDIDGDGDYDLFLAGNGYMVYFYRNNVNGLCKEDQESQTVENSPGYSKTVRVCDIDNDGVKDVYVAHKDWDNPDVGRIYHYEITDVTRNPPMLESRGMVKGGFFGDELQVSGGHVGLDLVDIDNDGDVDMFIGHKNGLISHWDNQGYTPLHWSLKNAEYASIDLGYDLGYFPAPFFADIDGNSTQDLFIGYLDPFHGADNPYVLSGIVGMYSPMRINADPRITHVVPFSPLDKMKMEARSGNWGMEGWLTPTRDIVESESDVALDDFYSSGGVFLRIPFTNPTDLSYRNPYFLIFNHQKVNRWEDEYGGTGVLIWHINENDFPSQDPVMHYEQPPSGRRRVEDVECAIGLFDTSGAKPGDATPCPEFGWDNIDHWTTPGNEPIWMDFNESHNASTGAATDFFGYEDRTEFSHVSNPSTNAYNFDQKADVLYQSGEWHTSGLAGHRFWEQYDDWGPTENIATHIAIKNIREDPAGSGIMKMDILIDGVQSDVKFATGANNARRLVWDGTKLHMVYVSKGHIYYTYREVQFGTMRWMPAIPLDQRDYFHNIPYPRPPEVENKYPALALDSNGKPCVCWVYEEGGLSKLYYYHPDLPAPYELYAPIPTDLCDFSGPSMAVDDQDLVHVVFAGRELVLPWKRQVKYGTFSATSPSPPSWYEVDSYTQDLGEKPGTASLATYHSEGWGGPIIAYTKTIGGENHVYSRALRWGSWRQPYHHGQGSNPSIDQVGNCLHLVWDDHEGQAILHQRGVIVLRYADIQWAGERKRVDDTNDRASQRAVITAGSQCLWREYAEISPGVFAYRIFHSSWDGQDWGIPEDVGQNPVSLIEELYPQNATEVTGTNEGKMHFVYTSGNVMVDKEYRVEYSTKDVLFPSLCAPILISPVEDTARDAAPTLTWEDVGAETYTVRYSVDPSLTNSREVTGITTTEYTIDGDTLAEDVAIYWQVIAFKDTFERISDTCSFHWDMPTTRFVATWGNDSWVGSKSQPWKTIQKAASELQPYERVFVRAGNYHEQVVPANSGSLSDRIYYVAYPGETVVLDGDGQLYGFNIHGKSYLTFDGFNLTDYATASVKISQAGTPASHNVIANCNITSSSVNSLQGIHIWGSSETLCKGNLIENTRIALNNEAFYNVKLEYAPNTQLLNDTLRYATYGVRIATGSDSVRIEDCVVSNMGSYGIYGHSNVFAPQILNNTLHKTGTYAGAFFQESRSAEIIGNSVDSSGTGSTGAAIWCDTRCDHAVIQGNNITLGEGQATIGIKTRTDCDSTTISGNTFTRSGDWSSEAAIYLGQSCNHVDIYANIVENASLSAIVVGGISGGCSGIRLWNNNLASKNIGISIPKKTQSNIRVWNNVIRAACGIRNFGARESWFGFCTVHADTAIYLDDFTGTADYDTLRNNILYGEDYCIYMKMMFFGPSGFSSDYNDLFTETGHVGYWKGSNKTTLSVWQSASGGDANSIASDPLFVSEADLHITESSSCVDAGTAISWITTDYDGQERSDPPDIGGDEWHAETGGGCMGGSGDSPFIFKLAQNYPNPFRQGTTIRYSIPKMGKVTLRVYDVTGRMVKQLVNKEQKPGVYTAHWQGNTPNSRTLATGVYFVRLTANEKTATRKLVMVR